MNHRIVFIEQNQLGRLYAVQLVEEVGTNINRTIVYTATVRGVKGKLECVKFIHKLKQSKGD